MSRRFLINCDDLGMHPTINKAVVALLSEGIIKSSSIMAPSLFFDDAVQRLMDSGIRRVGVHLTVNSEYPKLATRPLINESKSLADEDGIFFDCILKTSEFANLLELESELQAQIDRVLATGLEISHLDGHMFFYEPHIVGDRFLKIVRKLSHSLDVPYRSIRETSAKHPRKTHFIWEEFDTEDSRHAAYRNIITNPHNEIDEILIHPGLCIDEMTEFTKSGPRRFADYSFFASSEFKDLVTSNDIDIIAWDDL